MTSIRVRPFLTVLLIMTTLSSLPVLSYAQTCGAAPVAAASCSGGNGAVTSGANINGGNTYWFTGGPTSISSVNLSGGTLRVCGNLTITSMTINSGTIIVEAGGNLTITGSFPVGNLIIINRGTFNLNGSLTLQGTVSSIYNDLTTSVFTISGTLMVNNASTIINRGTFSVNNGLTLQGSGNTVCLQDNSIFNVTNLTNNVTNSFTYAGSGFKACLSVSGSATLNNAVTASSKIAVCNSTTTTTGWGSAVVTNGCSSCATVLALMINDLTAARRGDNIILQWTTRGAIHDGDIFFVERSLDGSAFETITTLTARDEQSSYIAADNKLIAPNQYYRIRTVTASGYNVYSIIALASTGLTEEPFAIYPNPIGPNGRLYIRLTGNGAGSIANLYLLDATGRTVGAQNSPLTQGNNLLTWRLPHLHPGVYFLRVVCPGTNPQYSPISILDGY